MDSLRTRQKVEERAAARHLAVRPEAVEASSPRPAAPAPGDPLDEFFWREGEAAPSLPDVEGAGDVRPSPEPAEVRHEWVAFLLGAEEYAVDIAHVREVMKAPAVTEVPRAPGHVLGIIMVRGEIIAVFDPRRQLGLPPAAPARGARVLVCDAGRGPRGILVDAVSGVVRLPASAIEVRPTGIGAGSGDAIVGIGRERGRMLILLDIAEVLRDSPQPKAEATP